ncbi:hypothetical protein ACSX1C_10655 [Pseudomonas sp. MBLB4123]|uniref:hypothetical protein n=1 Tax=Pseudomonas sp. MBLB4123 TaxID=3451557 RepID=UPI003F752690
MQQQSALNDCGALPHLIADPLQRERTYSFFDAILQARCESPHIRVRQLVTPAELEVLSQARLRLYAQRKKYYELLFGSTRAVDEIDSRSYVFACYYDDQIIGTQRVTPFPHEAGRYIDAAALNDFLGTDYAQDHVEFSRLIVDKTAPVKRVVDALACTAGSLVALNTPCRNYITYVKPRLQERFSQFSFDREALLFQIEERGDHRYALFKGNLLSAVIDFFKLDCHPQDLTDMDSLIALIEGSPFATTAFS